MDDWVCGRREAGEPCDSGPDRSGTCPMTDASCQPRRSIHALRRLVTRWSFVASVAMSLVLLGTGLRTWFASPGELSSSHVRATRLEARGSASCTDCHVAASDAASFLQALVRDDAAHVDASRCLSCHDMGEQATKAHGVSPSLLRRASGTPGDVENVDDWACATCHQEHRGRRAPVANLDDRRCQACHVARFDSFEHGHPEFPETANELVSVRFDHQTHRSAHFSKDRNGLEDRAFRCSDCHRPRTDGGMTLGSYEQTCASCHDRQIAESGDLVFLQLRGLDTLTLEETEVGIGQWPTEEEPAPSAIMSLLLSAGGDSGASLEVVDSMDPMDLLDAAPHEVEAVRSYAWSVKELFREISERGPEAISDRLTHQVGAGLTELESTTLLRALPRETLAGAARSWFPSLDAELEAHSAGRTVPTELSYPDGPEAQDEPAASPLAGSWHRDDLLTQILYRPSGHADPLLRAWIELGAAGAARAVFDELTGELSPGRCAKCHALDAGDVSWTSTRTESNPLTHFSHRPHLNLFAGEDRCERCHVFSESASGLAPITKAGCQTCHRRDAADNTCLLCHRYHGSLETRNEASLDSAMFR